MAQRSGRKRSHPPTESLESGSETPSSVSKRKDRSDSRYGTSIFLGRTYISIKEVLSFLIDIMEKDSLINGKNTEHVIARYHEAGGRCVLVSRNNLNRGSRKDLLFERNQMPAISYPYRTVQKLNYDEFKRSRMKEWPRPQS
jgi:hypothetical protein